MNLSTTDSIALAAFLVSLFALLATTWQVRGLQRQINELMEAKQGKIYKLKRAVTSLYEECQNVPALPDTSISDLLRFNNSRLSGIEASSDTFFFKEIKTVPGLLELLQALDVATQDMQTDLQRLKSYVADSIPANEISSAGEQLKQVYDLASKSDHLLNSVG